MDFVESALIAVIVVVWGFIIYDSRNSKNRLYFWVMPLFVSSALFFFELMYAIFSLQGSATALSKLIPVLALGAVIGLVAYLYTKKERRPVFKHFKKQTAVFFSSWKLDKKVFLIMLFDIILILVSFLGLRVWGTMAARVSASMPDIDPNIINPDNSGLMESQLSLIQGSIYNMILLSLVLVLFFIFGSSLMQGLIWKMLTRSKSLRYWKYLLLNLFWFAIWVVPILMPLFVISGYNQRLMLDSSLVFQVLFFLVIFLLIAFFLLHLSMIVNFQFYRKGLIFKSVGNAFAIGFGKIHIFIVPFVYLFAVMMLLNILTYWASFLISPGAYVFVNFIGLVFLLAWGRSYFVQFMETMIEKRAQGKVRKVRSKK